MKRGSPTFPPVPSVRKTPLSQWVYALFGLLVVAALAACPQAPPLPEEDPPASMEFCAASGRVSGEDYQGVICLAPVDPLVLGAEGGGYILQPGPIRFVLPVESPQ